MCAKGGGLRVRRVGCKGAVHRCTFWKAGQQQQCFRHRQICISKAGRHAVHHTTPRTCSSGSAPSSVTSGGASLRCSVVTTAESVMYCGSGVEGVGGVCCGVGGALAWVDVVWRPGLSFLNFLRIPL